MRCGDVSPDSVARKIARLKGGNPRAGAVVSAQGAGAGAWGTRVNIYQTVFEVIDMRSFSNLWFWIALAVMWSTASHWVLGVPYDMVLRARRSGGQAAADLDEMVRINVARILYISGMSGLWILGFACVVLTVLGLLGFWYWNEFAQALFLLAAPMMGVGALSIRTAHQIDAASETGDALRRRLTRHRFIVQFIGMLAIFVTAFWGMWQNMQLGVLGR